ncbi:peptidoglycan recognition protein family protein [Georgenia thermotolerans]|uniref:peptidoglycan recognition protein family protein n=1 Tax=Georgenia thermotolerans TaxID=527326 RepID=UPI001264896D|nr:peptidoglycan-binding domain-containing protein [Georgenia thermotolerans]
MAYDYITQYNSPNYTPNAKVPAAFGGPRTIEAITIHHWGSLGQKFQNVVNYLCRKGGNTSAHEVIEAGKVAVIVNHRDVAWHSGNGKGNRTTIGLELRPEATDADYATAAERIRDLRAEYGNLPLIPHRAWKATACPGKWDLARLDALARGGSFVKPVTDTVTLPKPTPTPKPSGFDAKVKAYQDAQRYYPGMVRDGIDGPMNRAHKAWVKTLQATLNKYKSDLPPVRVDGGYEDFTVRKVANIQKRNGLVPDGIAGPVTCRFLRIPKHPSA